MEARRKHEEEVAELASIGDELRIAHAAAALRTDASGGATLQSAGFGALLVEHGLAADDFD